MMTDDAIRRDLERLRDIVAERTQPDAAYATETATLNGQRLTVFAKAPRNLGEVYDLGLDVAERDFLVYQDQRHSFAATHDLALRLARALKEDYGIGAGDRVAICGRNSPEWCVAFMATTLIGAIAVPLNSWWQRPELEYALTHSGSRLVFADGKRLAMLSAWLGKDGHQAIAMKPDRDGPWREFHNVVDDRPPLASEDIAMLAVAPDDHASIMYTSGSTGHPKGVLSTHRNIVSALWTWCFVKEITEILRPELVEREPRWAPALLCNVPLFHVTGCHAQFLLSFPQRRKLVMMYRWDADEALRLIEAERISYLHGVPTMTWEVLQSKRFGATDLSSLRYAQGGGAARPPRHLRLMDEKFPAVVQPGLGYGLTETNALGTIISGDFYRARPHSTGRPSPPVTEMKIVDEAGETLPAGQAGEICIRGPSVMAGYWNEPQATAQVIRAGWFHSGDIGQFDELGFLVILDRAKDIVIRGGENIACAEVEYAISEHPAVSEVSAYGVPDERLGELLCATVMTRPGAALDAEALQAFLAGRIADFKIPARFFFRSEPLPRIASGKIAKKQLRAEAMDSLGLSPQPASPAP